MTCPESGFRYREENGSLRCLDLDEDSPLPSGQDVGTVTFDELKQRG